MRGTVQSMYGLIPGPAKYKFWFMNGGCSKFLKAYHVIVDRLRAEMARQTYTQTFVPQFPSGNFQEQFLAFADANDPSVLYVSQPPVASQAQPMQSYLGGYTGPTYNPASAPSHQPSPPIYQPSAPSYQPMPSYPPSRPSFQQAPTYPPLSAPYQQAPPYQHEQAYDPNFQPIPPTTTTVPTYHPTGTTQPNPYYQGYDQH